MVKGSPGSRNKSPGKKKLDDKGELSEVKLRSGVDTLHGFVPRVWCSLGQKIQVKNYEPIEIQFGFSEDVRKGETAEQTGKRIIAFVKKSIKPLIVEAQNAKKKMIAKNNS